MPILVVLALAAVAITGNLADDSSGPSLASTLTTTAEVLLAVLAILVLVWIIYEFS